MPVSESPDKRKITVTHPKGSTVEVLLYGATVISWKSPPPDNSSEPVERLFVSSKAFLDGSKAVRGGIPVVFPFFGAPTKPEHSKLPQHGFARSETWTWDGSTVMDNEAGVSIKLTLAPKESLTSDPVSLTYVITLAEHQLSTDLHVTNASISKEYPPKPVEFQALLHTYIRAPAQQVHVNGLSGLHYTDKTLAEVPRQRETRPVVDVQNFTDSVYEDGPREYEVTWPVGGIRVKAINLKDVVIWNPSSQAGGKLADMEPGGWDNFVCVEPGHVAGWASVLPGQTWIAGQTLSVIEVPRRF